MESTHIHVEATPDEVVEWLESREGESWSRGVHMSRACHGLTEAGIYSVKPLHDSGAISHMNMSRDTCWWHVFTKSKTMPLQEIKTTSLPPECV